MKETNNNKDYSSVATRGYYCGKYLPEPLKEAVLSRVEDLSKSDREKWKAFRHGLMVGMHAFRIEKLKRLHQIKDRSQDKDQGRSR